MFQPHNISAIKHFNYMNNDKYFSHEDRQKFLKALRNRQDLFQEEGILNLILDMIDKMNVITSQVNNSDNYAINNMQIFKNPSIQTFKYSNFHPQHD